MVSRVLRRLNHSRRLKRLIDVTGASVGLFVLSPLVVATTAAVGVHHGWPPLFVQRRPGQDGRIFSMVKLRTMTNERDASGNLLPDEQRLTPLGEKLRALSIDELPELWNVLKGEMSLVGPRPLLVSYLPLYNAVQKRRHDVLPGITGLAQVRGRNSISWEEKFGHDVRYVEEWSNALDIRILVETVTTVLRREGIQHGETATMPVFQGSPPCDLS